MEFGLLLFALGYYYICIDTVLFALHCKTEMYVISK